MTIRTVTYDDATHKPMPLKATDDMGEAMLFNNGGTKAKYAAAIAAAPPFTSLPNPDQEKIGQLNELLAAAYIELSGKSVHSSDCATSNAPAYTPGKCDCNMPNERKTDIAEIIGALTIASENLDADNLFIDALKAADRLWESS